MKKNSHDFINKLKNLYPNVISKNYCEKFSILNSKFFEDYYSEFVGLLLSMNAIDVDFCLKDPDVDIIESGSIIWEINPSYLCVDLEDLPGESAGSKTSKNGSNVGTEVLNQKSFLESQNKIYLQNLETKKDEITSLKKQVSTAGLGCFLFLF